MSDHIGLLCSVAACPENKFSVAVGEDVCKSCPAGSQASGTGNTRCVCSDNNKVWDWKLNQCGRYHSRTMGRLVSVTLYQVQRHFTSYWWHSGTGDVIDYHIYQDMFISLMRYFSVKIDFEMIIVNRKWHQFFTIKQSMDPIFN